MVGESLLLRPAKHIARHDKAIAIMETGNARSEIIDKQSNNIIRRASCILSYCTDVVTQKVAGELYAATSADWPGWASGSGPMRSRWACDYTAKETHIAESRRQEERELSTPSPNQNQNRTPGSFLGLGIAIGIVIGVGIGVALHQVALGIAIGVAIGVAVGSVLQASQRNRRKA